MAANGAGSGKVMCGAPSGGRKTKAEGLNSDAATLRLPLGLNSAAEGLRLGLNSGAAALSLTLVTAGTGAGAGALATAGEEAFGAHGLPKTNDLALGLSDSRLRPVGVGSPLLESECICPDCCLECG